MKRLTEEQFLSLNEKPSRYAKVIISEEEIEFPTHYVVFEEGDNFESIDVTNVTEFVRQDSHFQFDKATVEIIKIKN